jgi:hypothetical protein
MMQKMEGLAPNLSSYFVRIIARNYTLLFVAESILERNIARNIKQQMLNL